MKQWTRAIIFLCMWQYSCMVLECFSQVDVYYMRHIVNLYLANHVLLISLPICSRSHYITASHFSDADILPCVSYITKYL